MKPGSRQMASKDFNNPGRSSLNVSDKVTIDEFVDDANYDEIGPILIDEDELIEVDTVGQVDEM